MTTGALHSNFQVSDLPATSLSNAIFDDSNDRLLVTAVDAASGQLNISAIDINVGVASTIHVFPAGSRLVPSAGALVTYARIYTQAVQQKGGVYELVGIHVETLDVMFSYPLPAKPVAMVYALFK